MIRETYAAWQRDKAPRLAAALAFYTAFSLAPLLVILVAVAGLIFGEQAARGQIFGPLASILGPAGAAGLQSFVANAHRPASGVAATLVGFVLLLLGAAGLFEQLQDALNTIWGAPPRRAGAAAFIKERLLSFGMVLGAAFLLLVSLIASAGVAALSKFFGSGLPFAAQFLPALNFIVSFGIVTLVFGLIFKFLPDVTIDWHDCWIGALCTGLLFKIGEELVGVYLGRASLASSYGAAASLVVVLLWVYYSAQLVLLGAEFTKVYARQAVSRSRDKKETS